MQFKAEHSIWHSCQLITLKRGNSSNSFDFKEVYSLYRFTENFFADQTYTNRETCVIDRKNIYLN